ncbi:16S rRNA (guanine(527)-N(7))-methyltransferase RsmG, partial [Rhizobium ruizarguesonis]
MELNGLRVSRETQERLQHFAALFQKWAKAINLVAPSTLDDLWHRHIA